MYLAVYKCRLCGEKFNNGHNTNDDWEAEIEMRNACAYSSDFCEGGAIRRLKRGIPHNCIDGSVGFAEFQGLKKAEVSENE